MRACLLAVLLPALACGGGKGSDPAPPGGGLGSGGGSADGGSGSGSGEVLTPGGGDWAQYRHDPRGASENRGIFAASEAATLTPAWPSPLELGEYFYTQPLILDDLVVFTSAFSGKVVAVDRLSGAGRWSRDLGMPVSTDCGGSKKVGFWGSASVVGDVVYVAGPDGNATALRRSDGSILWTAKIADGTAAGHGEFVQSSPAVSTALGKLYVGVASSAHCDLIAGRVVAVDLGTHAVTSKTLVPAGHRGAGVWSSITIAEDENRLYATSGNRLGPIAEEPLAQSILALDPSTLDVLDHWQNPTTLENSDFGSSPTIFDAGGKKLVAATNKDGWLYVLRRDSLAKGPEWKYQLAVIDPSHADVGGDPVSGWGSISTPVSAGGRLFAAGGRTPQGETGSVIAFDPATGQTLWKHVTPGYVIAPAAAVGEVLFVESSAPDGTAGTLEVLEQSSGKVLKSFSGSVAIFGAPSVGHGFVVFGDALGHVTALVAPKYR